VPAIGTKVLVAMSGGVDSSVAAALLQQRGYEVVGCFMRLGSPGEDLEEGLTLDGGAACRTGVKVGHQGCCSINDAADARLVAARLGVPFYVCNFKRDFGRIIDYFVGEYNAGRTPNPCVRCNDWLKFGKLHEYAAQMGAACVASGHYARVDHGPDGEPRLRRGVDRSKDQSYVLFGAPRARLARMLLPVGEFRKSEVRRMARAWDLPVFDKPDSQEICFVPDNDYAGLVRRRTPEAVRPGPILDPGGRVIGAHPGQQHFTIGQRRGIGIASDRPLYVLARDPAANSITVGGRDALRAGGCVAREVNWLREPPRGWTGCSAKIRSGGEPVAARVRSTGPEGIEVRFDEDLLGVAPGQAVVCYHDDVVLCGGWIERTLVDSDRRPPGAPVAAEAPRPHLSSL
jgi:tRNA-specific 2-thiouridylase